MEKKQSPNASLPELSHSTHSNQITKPRNVRSLSSSSAPLLQSIQSEKRTDVPLHLKYALVQQNSRAKNAKYGKMFIPSHIRRELSKRNSSDPIVATATTDMGNNVATSDQKVNANIDDNLKRIVCRPEKSEEEIFHSTGNIGSNELIQKIQRELQKSIRNQTEPLPTTTETFSAKSSPTAREKNSPLVANRNLNTKSFTRHSRPYSESDVSNQCLRIEPLETTEFILNSNEHINDDDDSEVFSMPILTTTENEMNFTTQITSDVNTRQENMKIPSRNIEIIEISSDTELDSTKKEEIVNSEESKEYSSKEIIDGMERTTIVDGRYLIKQFDPLNFAIELLQQKLDPVNNASGAEILCKTKKSSSKRTSKKINSQKSSEISQTHGKKESSKDTSTKRSPLLLNALEKKRDDMKKFIETCQKKFSRKKNRKLTGTNCQVPTSSVDPSHPENRSLVLRSNNEEITGRASHQINEYPTIYPNILAQGYGSNQRNDSIRANTYQQVDNLTILSSESSSESSLFPQSPMLATQRPRANTFSSLHPTLRQRSIEQIHNLQSLSQFGYIQQQNNGNHSNPYVPSVCCLPPATYQPDTYHQRQQQCEQHLPRAENLTQMYERQQHLNYCWDVWYRFYAQQYFQQHREHSSYPFLDSEHQTDVRSNLVPLYPTQFNRPPFSHPLRNEIPYYVHPYRLGNPSAAALSTPHPLPPSPGHLPSASSVQLPSSYGDDLHQSRVINRPSAPSLPVYPIPSQRMPVGQPNHFPYPGQHPF